jgi:short-subunit dehydrogenase
MKVKLKPIAEQTIVITGASSGIGLATARMAASRGARVALIARSDNALEDLATEIREKGGEALPLTADVSVRIELDEAVRELEARWAGFDTWVNNAGISVYGKCQDVPLEDQRQVMEVTFWGTVYGSRLALPYLAREGGALINVGSVVSDRAIPLQGIYCAAKHAVKGYTDTLRMEIEKEKLPVSVTLIKPGSIDTPFVDHTRNYMKEQPAFAPPVYAPEVVAEAILYAAEHRVRDIFVGGASKFMSFSQHLPTFADRAMEQRFFSGQQSGTPNDPAKESLFTPSEDLRERSGRATSVKESSAYTTASLHPVISGMAFAFGMVALRSLVSRS